MLETDLRDLFARQAASELPPTPISIPAARHIGRARLLRRRATAFGSPVLAAGAVVAVVLAGLFAASPRQPATTPGGPAAPELFNPLVPYATATWYPYRPSLVNGADWHTALLLQASSRSPAENTEVVLDAGLLVHAELRQLVLRLGGGRYQSRDDGERPGTGRARPAGVLDPVCQRRP